MRSRAKPASQSLSSTSPNREGVEVTRSTSRSSGSEIGWLLVSTVIAIELCLDALAEHTGGHQSAPYPHRSRMPGEASGGTPGRIRTCDLRIRRTNRTRATTRSWRPCTGLQQAALSGARGGTRKPDGTGANTTAATAVTTDGETPARLDCANAGSPALPSPVPQSEPGFRQEGALADLRASAG